MSHFALNCLRFGFLLANTVCEIMKFVCKISKHPPCNTLILAKSIGICFFNVSTVRGGISLRFSTPSNAIGFYVLSYKTDLKFFHLLDIQKRFITCCRQPG